MSARIGLPLLSVALAALFAIPDLGAEAAPKARSAARPGMTYESLKALPDFSGGWVPDIPTFNASVVIKPGTAGNGPPPEMRPEVVTRYRDGMKQYLSGAAINRGYCAPATFGGRLAMDAGGSLEILYTPGRVTIAAESGLVRRIYLRDAPPPGALSESRAGTSVGRWEGKTLVVATTGISHAARFLPGIELGRGASAVERFSLQDPDTLRVQTTTTAPEVLLKPLRSVNLYKRARARTFTDFDTCIDGDRSFDQASKRERFDVTPPADLPPPPAN